jgi:putative transposase
MPRTRRSYPSDLTDHEQNLLQPLLASPERRGRPPKWPARRIADAVFYLLRSGCAWRMLPREYPPWQTVYYHFRKWRIDGRLRRAHDRLREAVREREGREPDPSTAVIDSQVVKITPVGGPERGYDGASVSPDASATSSWTRAAWCWPRGSTALTCPTGTAGVDC